MAKRQPGVAYTAEGTVEELFIVVRAAEGGTTVSLTYSTRRRGDEPGQGHRWVVQDTSTKQAAGFPHLSNLAAWAVRQAVRGSWMQVR